MYQDWLREVSERTAKLVAEWQRVGFVHGEWVLAQHPPIKTVPFSALPG